MVQEPARCRQTMLLTLLLAVICLFTKGHDLQGINLAAPVHIKAGSYRFDSLLNILSVQAGVKFSYNTNRLSARRIITLKAGSQTLREVMEQIKGNTGFNYKVVGSHIIFVEVRPANQGEKPTTGTGPQDAPVKRVTIQKQRQNDKNLALTGNASKKNIKASGQQMDTATRNDIMINDSLRKEKTLAAPDTLSSNPGIAKQNRVDSVHKAAITDTGSRAVTIKDRPATKPADAAQTANRRQRKRSLNVSEPADLRTLTRLDLGFQGIGPGAEFKLNRRMTLDVAAGAGGEYLVSPGSLTYTWDLLNPGLYLAVSPRYYYNLKQRAEKGKATRLNAGNYIGFRAKITTVPLGYVVDLLDMYLINVHWGLQRPIAKKMIVNAHVGAGYINYLYGLGAEGTFYPSLELKVAYIFSRI